MNFNIKGQLAFVSLEGDVGWTLAVDVCKRKIVFEIQVAKMENMIMKTMIERAMIKPSRIFLGSLFT